MRTIETIAYSFDELSAEAQERAIESKRQINVDFDCWHEYTIDDAKECARILGIEVDKIYYSGFWSQGDGACFVGRYAYAKQSTKKIREYAPADTELHRIADELAAIQKRYFYRIGATATHNFRYYHSRSTDIRVELNIEDTDYENSDDEEAVRELLIDFNDWIYKLLRAEYEYQTSDEAVKEAIQANCYEFDEEGDAI
jgi:hypothetical protein